MLVAAGLSEVIEDLLPLGVASNEYALPLATLPAFPF